MIYSMTGFASAAVDLEAGSLSLELRSVNNRYFDLQLKAPDEFRPLEPALRESVAAQVARGKIECRISFAPRTTAKKEAALNGALVNQLARWNREVQAVLPDARTLSVAEVLNWAGVLQGESAANDGLPGAAQALLQQVLGEFSAARAREGEKLKVFLLSRVDQIEALCASTAPRIPAAVRAYEEKLATRLTAVLQGTDTERLHQEIALFASKIDVDEELSRLAAHLAEMRRILEKGGAVGKKLDFMMQELNREANTLGSKSVDAEVSRASMDMKLMIEQMREQIQNIE
jgi:uncharacterized protein (TIGR00255 family)